MDASQITSQFNLNVFPHTFCQRIAAPSQSLRCSEVSTSPWPRIAGPSRTFRSMVLQTLSGNRCANGRPKNWAQLFCSIPGFFCRYLQCGNGIPAMSCTLDWNTLVSDLMYCNAILWKILSNSNLHLTVWQFDNVWHFHLQQAVPSLHFKKDPNDITMLPADDPSNKLKGCCSQEALGEEDGTFSYFELLPQ